MVYLTQNLCLKSLAVLTSVFKDIVNMIATFEKRPDYENFSESEKSKIFLNLSLGNQMPVVFCG